MRVLASSLTFSACPSGRSGIKKSRGPNLSRSSRLQPNSVVALLLALTKRSASTSYNTIASGACSTKSRNLSSLAWSKSVARDFISAGLVDLRIEFPYARQKDFAVGDLSSDHLQHRRIRFAGD